MRESNRLVILALLGWATAVLVHATLSSSAQVHFALSDAPDWIKYSAKNRNKCNIYIVGSSTVVFGLSAADIQAATGCATVNTGLLGIGNLVTSHLELVLQHTKPGDIVVVSDRNWSDLAVEHSYCAQQARIACFLTSLRFVPRLAEDANLVLEGNLQRSDQGDLLIFPPLAGEAILMPNRRLADFSYRLQVMAAQARKIRERGAIPILTTSPIFVASADRAELLRQYIKFCAEVESTVGAGVWLDPLLLTDPNAFSLEGRHTSAAGRKAWTDQVVAALR